MEEAGESARVQEEQTEASVPSLFPLFPVHDFSSRSPSDTPQWLYNASFTADISSLRTPAAAAAVGEENYSGDDEPIPTKVPAYELLESSSSEREESKRQTKKKKRYRSGDRGLESGIRRKPSVEVWAGSEAKSSKDYYFDTKGDRDNLAFGCLYRMDVARYRLCNPSNTLGLGFYVSYARGRKDLVTGIEEDANLLDRKIQEGGRYYSAKHAILGRHKDFKRLHVTAIEEPPTVPSEFIPLTSVRKSLQNSREMPMKAELEESWEDEVLRKTKEFNKMSREYPHDEKVWLAFAEFQDKVAAKQPQKGARLQTLEKKISILEKAVELNPDSEDLLLSLLQTYRRRDSSEVLIERWEKILVEHSGSCKLWKEFMQVCQSDFSKFKVPQLRKFYAYGIRALSAACMKLSRQLGQIDDRPKSDSLLTREELGLVDLFVSLCRFERQTGHQELATALFQSQLEYNLFCPSLLLSEQSKQRLFEHFWNSNGARVGEDGALGWSTWLEKEEETRRRIMGEESLQQDEPGGWTGWSEPLSRKTVSGKEEEKLTEDDVGDEQIRDDMEAELDQEENAESLLKKLGINVDADTHSDVDDPLLWAKWSKEESLRDSEQWMPVRENPGFSSGNVNPSADGQEQLSRIILFEDISEYLFSLHLQEARFFLLLQFIEFFGGKISQRVCTNNPSWTENNLSLDTFPYYAIEELRKVHEVVSQKSSSSNLSLESLLGTGASSLTNITKFLRNTILLCFNVFPRNYILEEALLSSEALFSSEMKSASGSFNPSRALAKSLLKSDRQDLLLCGVYARSEAALGNLDLARKIFDMALNSLEGLPLDLQANAPLLYFWYSEMEFSACKPDGDKDVSPIRAIHILSCLGSHSKYTPCKHQPSSVQLLRARQGFREQIKNVYSAWAHGQINDQAVALICSASLFEDLTSVPGSGLAILEEAFSMVLPERRCGSPQLEALFNYYVKSLQKNIKQSTPAKAWKTILQGLQMYPYNPSIFAFFVEISCLYMAPIKLRQLFDEHFIRKPSVIIWLFAMAFELGRSGSHHRIHGLFERALGDNKLQKSVLIWRFYLAYELHIGNISAARRIFFRAIHACPWSKRLWLDGFLKLHTVLSGKELSDLQEIMRDKEINLRTDIYEILLQDEIKL